MIFGGQYYLVTLRTLDKSIHHSGPNEKGCSAARIRGSPKSSNPRGSHHPGPASTRVSSPRPATRTTRQGTRRPGSRVADAMRWMLRLPTRRVCARAAAGAPL
eukprot:scaffold13354_cov60-Phaeocystis_antarctica.AAC.2